MEILLPALFKIIAFVILAGCGDSGTDSQKPDLPIGVGSAGHPDGYSIRGHVVDGDGNPVEEVVVRYYDHDPSVGPPTLEILSGSDGSYSFEGLPSWGSLPTDYSLAILIEEPDFERALFWPMVAHRELRQSTALEQDLAIYRIVQGTAVEGRILPAPLSTHSATLVLISLGRDNDWRQGPAYNPRVHGTKESGEFYYEPSTGRYHIRSKLAGGRYLFHINLSVNSNAPTVADVVSVPVDAEPGVTTTIDWSLRTQ